MGLSIENNLMALTASRNLAATYGALSKSIGRLSSGLRITGAADDAAGLAVRELMRSDITVLNQGIRNANNAISLLQTMDGAASVIDEKLIRMKELAEQAATGTYSSAQRAIMHDEFNEMRLEIERIAQATAFNEVNLLTRPADVDAVAQIMHLEGNSAATDSASTFVDAFTTLGISTTAAASAVTELAVIDATAAKPVGSAFVDAFSLISVSSATGDFNIGLQWKNQAGTQTNDVIAIDSAMTITSVMALINTEVGASMTVGYSSATGFTITAVSAGASEISIELIDPVDMDTYSTSATTEGVDETAATTDTFYAQWTDHTGDLADANISVTHGDTIATVMGRLNAVMSADMGITFVTPTAPANDYFQITDVSAGVSELGLTFNDQAGTAVELSASTDTAGVDAATSAASDVTIHFGTGNDETKDYYDIEAQDLTKDGLGISALSITTQGAAQSALTTLDDAILAKDEARAHFGAMINRLENTVTNITIQAENIQAAESQISDVDVATEMTQFVNLQIKAQAASAMLAQANMMPQMALTLLGGA